MSCPTVLYAWELGWGLGHYSRFSDVADHLSAQGVRVAAALRDTSTANACKTDIVIQAPFTEDTNTKDPVHSCGDVLLHHGFSDHVHLLEMVKKWRAIIKGVGASLVVADFAPTAILAARSMGIPVMLLSAGFDAPPRISPLPNLRPWANSPAEWLSDIERRVVLSINTVLHQLGSDRLLHHAYELFDVESTALATIPEFDHFPRPGGQDYWGVLRSKSEGIEPQWPEGHGQKVFCYVSATNPYCGQVLDCLAKSQLPSIVFLPDQQMSSIHCPSTMRIYSSPLNLSRVSETADIGITHAGVTTTSTLLMHGKPVLCIPETLEQFLYAGRLKFSGVADMVAPQQESPNIEGALQAMLSNDRYRVAAKAIAAKYRNHSHDVVAKNIAAGIFRLLSK